MKNKLKILDVVTYITCLLALSVVVLSNFHPAVAPTLRFVGAVLIFVLCSCALFWIMRR